MSFNELGLSQPIVKAVALKGYDKPSPIQEKVIPHILKGRDVLASAQTGTGKTAGFTLPILEILSKHQNESRRPIRALVLTPTRELAAQIYDNVREYGKFLNLRSTVIFGGVKAGKQISTLKNGVDILIATPGRLLDLHNQRALSLAKIEVLVLDEADRMLDMGFARDLNKILKLMPAKRRNLLFSATFSKEIKKLAHDFMQDPILVEATPENTTVEKINQKVYRLDKSKKTEYLIKLISEGEWSQVLVFTRTKHGANKLSQKLAKKGITTAAIHGNKAQGARTKALAEFKAGKIRVLVATDIAARGLDIPLLPYVINFELPNVPADYVHRIGRTGRAGASGEAISLVSGDEKAYLRDIEKLVGEKITSKIPEGFEPDVNAPKEIAEAGKKPNNSNSRRRNWSRERKNTSGNGSGNPSGGRRKKPNSRNSGGANR